MSVASVLVETAIISALYALVAIGFTLIFGVGGVLNLAHGASITVGAYTTYYVTRVFGYGVGVGILAAVAASGLFGAVLYLGLVKRIQDEPILVMITTLVTAVAIEQVVVVLVGTEEKSIPALLRGNADILGTNVQLNMLAVFVLSWVVIAGLFAFVNYTKAGKALLATSMSHKGAALVGIEADRINLMTWVLAGAIAGLAGVFLGSFQTASYAMGQGPLVLSFTIVVLGGIGSIKGSVLGAYLIGFLEIMTIEYISPSLTGLTPLIVLVAVLLAKPEGLFGRELVEA
ncbi:branched-chain amino acid ABC transporter permease [Halomarina ordinaria]|uniref:Branched-chain amino acid ABC transporter permease n=1 Tax=Halomarina ordinaria TaxID=3033939 RepID=A0ABD5U6S8_9EURY|nr:branched-chain amino acid ABC transporter permease [Halomarina sp. PSRA2]